MNERSFWDVSQASWRTFMWPLDALRVPPFDDAGGANAWRNASNWWIDALGEGADTWPNANDQLSADTVARP